MAVDSTRGLELLGSLAAALADPETAVAAAAMPGLAALLAAGDLDFYKAWPVLCKTAGFRPAAALAAVGAAAPAGFAAAAVCGSSRGSMLCAAGAAVAGWVGLLKYGVADAAAEPEVAAAVVAVMQLAAAAADPRVSSIIADWRTD
jgi:hypothetical protein